MRLNNILNAALITSSLLFSSCQKEDRLSSATAATATVAVKIDTTATAPSTTTPTTYKRVINVGTGSGTLNIDGTTMGLQCNDLIKIQGGSYSTINIKNILSPDGCPITIKNDGLVEVVGNFNTMNISDVKNLTISGDGTSGIEKGFSFRDNTYRSVNLNGAINKFTFQYFSFKNIGNMVISFPFDAVYDGSADSYMTDLKFLHNSCENTNQFIGAAGSSINGVIKGFLKNVEIAYLDFRNSAGPGTVVYMANVENYDVHHNRIDNINSATNNHNGIFMLAGNGKFYNNYISNHQGNAIRAWGFTIGSTPKNILIYNNIVVNSRKYSGFEVQAFAENISAGKTTYVNAVVFNNTCGNLNLSNDWQGNVVDVYSLKGGKCDVYNNIGYHFPTGGVIAGQENDLLPNSFNNLLAKNFTEAGIENETTFKLTNNSPAKNKGTATPIVITDYYGNPRNSLTPSMGAVE